VREAVGAFDKTPSSLTHGTTSPDKAVAIRAWYRAFFQTPLQQGEASAGSRRAHRG
jgi:hypothetical protein